ncbi:MAG: hypothetical protein AB7O44_28850 [Hyphomicrobiaceae bacterium]
MDIGELVFGIVMVAVSLCAFWFSLPKEDGQVRPFLRSDHAQSYFAVVILGMFALGIVNIVTGLVPGQAGSLYDNRPTKK